MTRCKNDILIGKIGAEKLQKTTEVDFTVHHYLPDCRRIKASKYVQGSGAFNSYLIPKNQFECVRDGCTNSGTLFSKGVEAIYKATYDAVEFAAGVLTFYTTGSNGTAVVKISDSATLTNADVYSIGLSTIETAADGYKAVVVDLSQTPSSETGDGWTPNHVGAYISISITTATGDNVNDVGISSLAIYDSLEDFETTHAVRIACLSTVGGTWDFEAVEATCFGNAGYNDETIDSFEKTVTGKALTPNYWMLNPMFTKGDATEGWDTNTVEKVVEAEGDFGVIVLPDKFAGECGFVNVSRKDNCNVTDAQLIELTVPGKVDIDEKHFLVVDNEDGSASIYVNSALVGQTLVVAYPQTVEVEEYVFDKDNVRYVKTRMSYTRVYNDGVKYRFVFDNVLITSFPDEITDEETEFEFTITVQADRNGRYGRAYRIVG